MDVKYPFYILLLGTTVHFTVSSAIIILQLTDTV